MRIERIQAKQGHPVPKSSHRPVGPFPPELFQLPEMVIPEQAPEVEGATAQNNFEGVRYFRCRFCEEVLTEHETFDHACEESIDG